MRHSPFRFFSVVVASLFFFYGCGGGAMDPDTETQISTENGTSIGTESDSNTGSESNSDTGTETDTNKCTTYWTSQCYDGDVWSYNSCTGRDSLLDKCDDCETCVNTSDDAAECRATVYCKYEQCGADGHVKCVDSCDVEGGIAMFCDPQCTKGCRNTTGATAECVPLGDFTACVIVTEPDRSYDICIAGRCVSPGCGDRTCNVSGPHFPLADTNQRTCYSDSDPMTCPSPGQDFFGQDAQYGWDVTHLANARYTRTTPGPNRFYAEPVVKDNVTGLVWQGCIAGLAGTDCAIPLSTTTYKWVKALEYCEHLDWGGITDWRLPDPYELSSILDSGRGNPAIDTAAFLETPSDFFWSSSSDHIRPGEAWMVHFELGESYPMPKTSYISIRCVRSGP